MKRIYPKKFDVQQTSKTLLRFHKCTKLSYAILPPVLIFSARPFTKSCNTMATQVFSDKLATALKKHSTSWGTMLAGSPLLHLQRTISCQWTSNTYPSQIERLSPTKSSQIISISRVDYVRTHRVEALAQYYNVLAFNLGKKLQDIAKELKGLSI